MASFSSKVGLLSKLSGQSEGAENTWEIFAKKMFKGFDSKEDWLGGGPDS